MRGSSRTRRSRSTRSSRPTWRRVIRPRQERNSDDGCRPRPMLDAFLAQLKSISRRGARPRRVSIFLPFLIISLGLGGLAWRSYTLSVKTERGVTLLAGQYARYAAEITALRVDAA